MATKSLTWNGDVVNERMKQAAIAGVDRTMGQCVTHAKANHPWQNRTGILEGDIQIQEYAVPAGAGVKGVWGVRSESRQALILELGGTIVPVKAKALKIPMPDGSFRFVKSVTIPPYPYLRPAADQIYPRLSDNIRKAYAALGKGGKP